MDYDAAQSWADQSDSIPTAALGAGGPEFKSRRPDQNISRVFSRLMKVPFTQNSSVEFWQTGVLNSQVVYFLRVRQLTNLEKHGEAGVLFRNQ